MADLATVLASDLVGQDCGLLRFDLLVLLEVRQLLLRCDRLPRLDCACNHRTLVNAALDRHTSHSTLQHGVRCL